MENISAYFDQGICISCGICAGNCPKHCITMKQEGFFVKPFVDSSLCVACGKCLSVCPNSSFQEPIDDVLHSIEQYMLGSYISINFAKAKDKNLLMQCTSGGVVTSLIKKLLGDDVYDVAFCVSGYHYTEEQVLTEKFDKESDFSQTPRSRYLTVNHQSAVRYLLDHPKEKIIITGTPCVISGFVNTIEKNHLSRENYLLIGLFCDKTMHYGVIDYFKHYQNQKKRMTDFHFRLKSISGWPGDVRICYDDQTHLDLPNTERMKVKDFFMPERCLYCLDKLNRQADIAVGDNYIRENRDVEGASSVMLRTEKGREIWEACKALFELREDSEETFLRSLSLKTKRNNYYYAFMKGLYRSPVSIPDDIEKKYQEALKKLEIGKTKDPYRSIHDEWRKEIMKAKQEQRQHRKKKIKKLVSQMAQRKNKNKSFLIWGGGFKNKGAQAMLLTTVSELKDRFPGCQIFVNTNENIPSGYGFIPVQVNVNMLDMLSTKPVYRYARSLARLLFKKREDIFEYCEQRGRFRNLDAVIDISGYALSSQFEYKRSYHYLEMIETSRRYHIPVFLMPQSFGPFDYAEHQMEMDQKIADALSYPIVIYAREKQGYDFLTQKYGLKNIKLSYDLVLQSKITIQSTSSMVNITLNNITNSTEIQAKNNVAIIPNVQNLKRGNANQEELLQLYKQIIVELVNHGKHIYLLKHCETDSQACCEIYQSLDNITNVVLLEDDYNCVEFNELIGNFDFIIASRYHSIVHAFKNNVPAIVLGWAEKYYELMEMFDLNHFMFDVRSTIDAGSVLNAVREMEQNYHRIRVSIKNKLACFQTENCFDSVSEYFGNLKK